MLTPFSLLAFPLNTERKPGRPRAGIGTCPGGRRVGKSRGPYVFSRKNYEMRQTHENTGQKSVRTCRSINHQTMTGNQVWDLRRRACILFVPLVFFVV